MSLQGEGNPDSLQTVVLTGKYFPLQISVAVFQ